MTWCSRIKTFRL